MSDPTPPAPAELTPRRAPITGDLEHFGSMAYPDGRPISELFVAQRATGNTVDMLVYDQDESEQSPVLVMNPRTARDLGHMLINAADEADGNKHTADMYYMARSVLAILSRLDPHPDTLDEAYKRLQPAGADMLRQFVDDLIRAHKALDDRDTADIKAYLEAAEIAEAQDEL